MAREARNRATHHRSSSGQSRRVAIVLNPTAGRGARDSIASFQSALAGRGLACCLLATHGAGHAVELARSAAADVVVAAGGDGTLNEVLNGLMQRPEPRPILALLPLGSANVVAHEIGLAKAGPEELARLIDHGAAEPIYVGQVNDRYFIQMAGVGFDAHVVQGVAAGLKRVFGRLAYVWRALVEIVIGRRNTYRVLVGAAEHRAASVIVANGRYYAGRFAGAPQARINHPDLKVCLFERAGRLNTIRYALGLLMGRLHRMPGVRILSATSLRIEALSAAGRAEPIQADGDVVGHLPASILAHAGPRLIMPSADRETTR